MLCSFAGMSVSLSATSLLRRMRPASLREQKAGHISPSAVRNTCSFAAMERLNRPPRPDSGRSTPAAAFTASISSGLFTTIRRTRPGMRSDIPMVASLNLVPRREGVVDAFERHRQLRHVPLQHGLHGIVVDPVHAELGVDLGAKVVGEEPVALEAPRGHQDEDAEDGIAEPESVGEVLRQGSDQEIDAVDVVLVDLAQLGRDLRLAGDLLERLDALLAHELAEAVVARYAALTIAHDVDRRHIHERLVELLELAQEVRIVADREGAGVLCPERVQEIGKAVLLHQRARELALDVEEWIGRLLAAGERADQNVLG